MKALILCYSTTGNTRLVAKRMGKALEGEGLPTEVRDPVRDPRFPDLAHFGAVGFGAPTMGWKPSFGFHEIIGLLPGQKKAKPAFVFCTNAGMPANTLRLMSEALAEKNFVVIDGIAVKAEDCWPVARQLGGPGLGPVHQPDEEALGKVAAFAKELAGKLKSGVTHPKEFAFERTPLHYLGQAATRDALRLAMGRKRVDYSKCQQCGTCARGCASRAISLSPYPVFSNRCMGCWACYNNCPSEAITTSVTGGRGRYRGPAIRA